MSLASAPSHLSFDPCWPCWLLTLLSLAQVSNLKGWKTWYSWPPQEGWPFTLPPTPGPGYYRLRPAGALPCSSAAPPVPLTPTPGPPAFWPCLTQVLPIQAPSLPTGLPLPSWPSTHAHSLSVHTQLPSTPLCSQQAWGTCACKSPAQPRL